MVKSSIKILGVLAGIALIVYLLYTVTNHETQVNSAQAEQLAQCLSEKGAIMYGTLWCPHCNNQKSLFGDSFKSIDFIDCDADTEACLQAGIQGYPTWYINGELYPGEMSLQELALKSGCSIQSE